MDLLRRRGLALTLIAAAACFAPAPARAQMTMVESGFTIQQLSDDLAKQAEIGSGAGGDTCLYYGSFDGLKRRCNPYEPPTICDANLTFPAGIAFSTGGSFGSFMYVADFGLNGIYRSPGCTTSALFAAIDEPGAIAFPPAASAYGDYLYACRAFSGPIKRVSSAGVITDWVTLSTIYLRFGPGGAWSSGLYATDDGSPGSGRIVTVSSTGTIAPVTTGIVSPEGFDWAFDGDLFATDVGAGQVLRVKPNGTKTVFATLSGAADVAFRKAEQALYVVSNQGGLYRVVRAGTTAVPAASPRARAASVAPNPARGTCTLRWSAAFGGLTHALVVDAAGRRVRDLGAAWRPAGEQSVAWDGRDDAGAPVDAGVYFARIARGPDLRSVRITRVR